MIYLSLVWGQKMWFWANKLSDLNWPLDLGVRFCFCITRVEVFLTWGPQTSSWAPNGLLEIHKLFHSSHRQRVFAHVEAVEASQITCFLLAGIIPQTVSRCRYQVNEK